MSGEVMNYETTTELPTWPELAKAMRALLVVQADSMRQLLGYNSRGNLAANSLLGVESPDSELIADHLHLISDSVLTEGTELERVVKKCFELCSQRQPIESIDPDSVGIDGVEWLEYFVDCIPKSFQGAFDPRGVLFPLESLLAISKARFELIRFVHSLFSNHSDGILTGMFTPKTIAILANVDIRAVRNVVGPTGNKSIRSFRVKKPRRNQKNREDEFVYGEPLEALAWLASRRSFFPGPLSHAWVNERLPSVENLHAAAALPGVLSWINRVSTESLAERSGLSVKQLQDWFRGNKMNLELARPIADVTGLDPTSYTTIIARLLAK
jgi:hypothetical protein